MTEDMKTELDTESGHDVIDVAPTAPATKPTDKDIERVTAEVITQIKTIFDPEIPVVINELGLIYKVQLEDDWVLKVDMTLTAPGCPVAGEMPIWVQEACIMIDGVVKVEVDMVFDPPWTPDLMSDEARLELNMF